jgi:hypothetical protein
VGYNNTTASSANVRFDFEGALAAARDLHALADSIRAAQVERVRAADTARAGWVGPKRLELDLKMDAETDSSRLLADSIAELASRLATAWAAQRGNQDRINQARWQDHEEANKHNGELNVIEYTHKLGDSIAAVFGHGTDYPPPPDDPPVPVPPRFEPTRGPVHPEFEHSG